MRRNSLSESLTLIKLRVGMATVRFVEMTEGVDHPRVDTARSRLQAAGVAVTRAAGGLSPWTRTWLDAAVVGVACWAVAAFTGQVVGLSHGWTLTVTVGVLLGLFWPMYVLTNALAARVNQWRTTRSAPSAPIVVPVDVGSAAEVLALLRIARDGLSVALKRRSTAHRFGYLMQTADGFDWLRRRDQRLYWLSQADRQLCEAVYSIELWLPSQVDRR